MNECIKAAAASEMHVSCRSKPGCTGAVPAPAPAPAANLSSSHVCKSLPHTMVERNKRVVSPIR
jgi:hypothetical protein